MKRSKFLWLLLTPFLLVIPVISLEPSLTWQIGFMIAACIFIWVVQFLRLKYLGLDSITAVKAWFAGPFGKYWWKMWQRDPNEAKMGS